MASKMKQRTGQGGVQGNNESDDPDIDTSSSSDIDVDSVRMSKEIPRKITTKTIGNVKRDCNKSNMNEGEDELGEMIEIKLFIFTSRSKLFVIQWSRGGMREHPAHHVIKDWPIKALHVIWRDHRDNMTIRNWINKYSFVKLN